MSQALAVSRDPVYIESADIAALATGTDKTLI
jgi:hypothetical protein